MTEVDVIQEEDAGDANADLIGYTFVDESGLMFEVQETWSVSDNYVVLRAPSKATTIQNAGTVRRRKQIEATTMQVKGAA